MDEKMLTNAETAMEPHQVLHGLAFVEALLAGKEVRPMSEQGSWSGWDPDAGLLRQIEPPPGESLYWRSTSRQILCDDWEVREHRMTFSEAAMAMGGGSVVERPGNGDVLPCPVQWRQHGGQYQMRVCVAGQWLRWVDEPLHSVDIQTTDWHVVANLVETPPGLQAPAPGYAEAVEDIVDVLKNGFSMTEFEVTWFRERLAEKLHTQYPQWFREKREK